MIRPSRCASSWREPNDPLTWIATAASGRSIEKLATLLTTRRDTSPVRNAPNSRCRSRTVVAPVINGASRCSASSASWSRYWPITSTWSSACLATRRSVTRFLPDAERLAYATAEREDKYRLAATASGKNRVTERLVARHADDQVLVIGQYLDQLAELAEHLDAPLITGATTVRERQRLFGAFRTGEVSRLVVSKVANFSIDLPEAAVAIQVSGSFGSRQEEAQRLGRIMRPKADGRTATFYTVVSRDTVDQDFAAHRQRFLAEQGYTYRIIDAEDLV